MSFCLVQTVVILQLVTYYLLLACLSAGVQTVVVLQLVTHYLLLAYALLHGSKQWGYCHWSHTIFYWHMSSCMGPHSDGTATGHTLFGIGICPSTWVHTVGVLQLLTHCYWHMSCMGPHSGDTATGHTLFVIGICLSAWVHTAVLLQLVTHYLLLAYFFLLGSTQW